MFIVDVDNWETLAQERDIRRSIIVDGAVTSESDSMDESRGPREKDNFASPEPTITLP